MRCSLIYGAHIIANNILMWYGGCGIGSPESPVIMCETRQTSVDAISDKLNESLTRSLTLFTEMSQKRLRNLRGKGRILATRWPGIMPAIPTARVEAGAAELLACANGHLGQSYGDFLVRPSRDISGFSSYAEISI
jgi:hypothetical protein